MKSKYMFNTKTYIEHTYDGLRDFFFKYLAALPGVKAKTGTIPTDLEIQTLTRTTNGLDNYNRLIDVATAFVETARDARHLLITQKSADKIPPPDAAPLVNLCALLKEVPGGILWQEDNLTDRIKRSGKCNEADYDALGITHRAPGKANPDTMFGKLYVDFDGGKVPAHWTLPRGWHLARLSRSVNHKEWVHLVTTDQCSYVDVSPVPSVAEIRAYKLEIMDGDKPIGKPVIEKILVGMDINVEESRL